MSSANEGGGQFRPEQLAAAVAALRREIDAGQAGWSARLEELAAAMAHLPAQSAGAQARLPYIGLLDELHELATSLERQRATLAGQIRNLTLHRRAGAAYHRGAGRP